MASKDSHYVHRFQFDFEVEDREKGKSTQNELSRIFHNSLQRILEEALDEFQVEGHLLRIQNLELDLGDLSESYFESDLIDRFRSEIRRELSEIRANATYSTSYFYRNAELIPLWPAKLEVVSYFLEYGRLPSSAARFPQRVDEVLGDLVREIPNEVKAELEKLFRKEPNVSQRLIEQFSPTIVEQVFRIFNDSYFSFIQREYQTLAEQIAHEYGLNSRSMKKLLQEAALVHLVKLEGRAFNRVNFFKSVRRFAERRTKQDLERAFPSEDSSDRGNRSALDERYAAFIRLVRKALEGNLAPTLTPRLINAFEVLIRFHSEGLKDIIKEEGNGRKAYRSLVQNLPTESLHRYVQQVSPGTGSEILRVALRAIAAHSRFLKGPEIDARFRNETYTALIEYVSRTSSGSQSRKSFSEFLKDALVEEVQAPAEMIETWREVVEEGIEPGKTEEKEIDSEAADTGLGIEGETDEAADAEIPGEEQVEDTGSIEETDPKEEPASIDEPEEDSAPDDESIESDQPEEEKDKPTEESEEKEASVETEEDSEQPSEDDTSEEQDTAEESSEETSDPETAQEEDSTDETSDETQEGDPEQEGSQETEREEDQSEDGEKVEEQEGDVDPAETPEIEADSPTEEKGRESADGEEENVDEAISEVSEDVGGETLPEEDGTQEESLQESESSEEDGGSTEEEIIEPKKGDSERTRIDYVLHILETGEIPWWSKNLIEPSPSRAFMSLLEQESKDFLTAFREKVQEASIPIKAMMANRVLEMFGDSGAQSLLKQALPELFGLYVTVSMVVERYLKLANPNILPQSLQDTNSFKWYPIVRFFLDHVDAPPGPPEMIRYVLRMVAATTGESISKTTEIMRQVVMTAVEGGEMRFLPFQTLLPRPDQDVTLESDTAEESIRFEEEIFEALLKGESEEEAVEEGSDEISQAEQADEVAGEDGQEDSQEDLGVEIQEPHVEGDENRGLEGDEGSADETSLDSPHTDPDEKDLPSVGEFEKEEGSEEGILNIEDETDSSKPEPIDSGLEKENISAEDRGIEEGSQDEEFKDSQGEKAEESSLVEDSVDPKEDDPEFIEETPAVQEDDEGQDESIQALEEEEGKEVEGEGERNKEEKPESEETAEVDLPSEEVTEDVAGDIDPTSQESVEEEAQPEDSSKDADIDHDEKADSELGSEVGKQEEEEEQGEEGKQEGDPVESGLEKPEEVEGVEEAEETETVEGETDVKPEEEGHETSSSDEGDETSEDDTPLEETTQDEVPSVDDKTEEKESDEKKEEEVGDSDEIPQSKEEIEAEIQKILDEPEVTIEDVVIYYLRSGSLPPEAGNLSEPAVWTMIQEVIANNPTKIEELLREIGNSESLEKRIANLPTPIFEIIARLLIPQKQEEQFTRFFREIKKLFSLGPAPLKPVQVAAQAFRFLIKTTESTLKLEEYISDLIDFMEAESRQPKTFLLDWLMNVSRENPSLVSVTLEEVLASIKGELEIPVDEPGAEEPEPEELDDSKIPVSSDESGEEEPEIYIGNAGLVLFSPMLSTAFKKLEYLDLQGRFATDLLKERAIHFLAYLSHKQEETPEEELVLNKLMTGWELNTPIQSDISLTEGEMEVAEGMIDEIRSKWRGMENTSNDTFRTSWMQRAGRLKLDKYSTWVLRVDQKAYDLLLSRLPFSFQVVDSSWSNVTIRVEWE